MLHIFRQTVGRWIAGAILGLIAISFIFWGVDFSLTGTTYAAKVNGQNIPIEEFNRELQSTQNQYIQIYQTELDDELRRQLRRSVIERMVAAEAMRQRVEDLGYRVSDERLVESIRSIEAFQVGGEFSMDVYRVTIANNLGISVRAFEQMQRQDLALQDLQRGITNSSFITPAELRRYIEIADERRDVSYALFPVEAFTEQVEITSEAIRSHYEENAPLYMSEESVDFNYVELSLDSIAAGIEVTEEDLRTYYDENRDQFETQEERRAAHILLEHAEGEREAALEQAEEIRRQLEQGASFEELAAEYSDDAGTANQGGDLGWIATGTLPGPFEDALYSLDAVGDVTEPVETEFGVHLIRLEDVRAGEVEPFEAVRDELREELSTRRAEDIYYERANRLADLAFDAYDELASVAAELDIELKMVEGFSRSSDEGRFENRAAVAEAAFDEENVTSGTNSDLVELSEDHVMVLRVTEHHPPSQLPLEAVEAEIRAELTRERASELAGEAVDAYTQAVEQGADREAAAAEHGGEWHAPGFIQRDNGQLPSQIVSVAFSLPEPAGETPVRERVMLSNGDEAVVFVGAVEPGDPERLSTEEREQMRMQLMNRRAQAAFNAYATTVREQASVSIPQQVLEPQF